MLTDLNPFDMAKERSEKKYSISCHHQTKCHVRWSGVLSPVPDSHTELELISSTLESVRNDALQHASGLAERTEQTEKTGQPTGLRHTVSTASLRGHCHVFHPCTLTTYRYPCSGGDGKELWIIFK